MQCVRCGVQARVWYVSHGVLQGRVCRVGQDVVCRPGFVVGEGEQGRMCRLPCGMQVNVQGVQCVRCGVQSVWCVRCGVQSVWCVGHTLQGVQCVRCGVQARVWCVKCVVCRPYTVGCVVCKVWFRPGCVQRVRYVVCVGQCVVCRVCRVCSV